MKLKSSLLIALSLGAMVRAGAETTAPAAPAAAPAAATAAPVAAPAAVVPPAPVITEAQAVEAFGWYLLKSNGMADQLSKLEFSKDELDSLQRGMRAALEGKASVVDLEKAGPVLDALLRPRQEKQIAKQKAQAAAIAAEADRLVAEAKKKPGTVTSTTGLVYEVVKPGTGDFPKDSDIVTVHYTGTLADGSKFDSSYDHPDGQPATFPLNGVIPGWTEGLQKINRGGKIHLIVPPQLGYGDASHPGIPGGSTLFFDVELLDFKAAPVPEAAPAAPAAAPAAPAAETAPAQPAK